MSEVERKFDFEVNNSKELNKMLTGVLMDVRRGSIDHESVKSITLIADKINKNNSNAIDYKRISKHKNDIEFFQTEEKPE